MKPTDPTDLLNVEAMQITTAKEAKLIKEIMEKAWRKTNN